MTGRTPRLFLELGGVGFASLVAVHNGTPVQGTAPIFVARLRCARTVCCVSHVRCAIRLQWTSSGMLPCCPTCSVCCISHVRCAIFLSWPAAATQPKHEVQRGLLLDVVV